MVKRNELPAILLSGKTCTGKTTLAVDLVRALDGAIVHARAALRDATGAEESRLQLQKAGRAIEEATHGAWLADAAMAVRREAPDAVLIVDAVRTRGQLQQVSRALGPTVLVHLFADTAERRRRFDRRDDQADLGTEFELLDNEELEMLADDIATSADQIVDTTSRGPAEVLAEVIKRLPTAS